MTFNYKIGANGEIVQEKNINEQSFYTIEQLEDFCNLQATAIQRLLTLTALASDVLLKIYNETEDEQIKGCIEDITDKINEELQRIAELGEKYGKETF